MTEGRLAPDHATAIAQALGSWTYAPRNDDRDDLLGNRCALVYSGDDPLLAGARLDLTVGGYRHQGQVHCSASLHHGPPEARIFLGDYLSYNERNALVTSINCSETRTDVQIARDIARRLLPGYLQSYQNGLRQFRQCECRHRTQQWEAEELARLLGGAQVRHGSRVGDESVIYHQGGLPTLRVMSHGVRTEYFSMTYAQARLLVQLFASEAWTSAAKA